MARECTRCRSASPNCDISAQPGVRDVLHGLQELVEHVDVHDGDVARADGGLVVDDLDVEFDVPRVLGLDDDADESRALEPACEGVPWLHPQTLQDEKCIPVGPGLVLGAGGCGDGHDDGHGVS